MCSWAACSSSVDSARRLLAASDICEIYHIDFVSRGVEMRVAQGKCLILCESKARVQDLVLNDAAVSIILLWSAVCKLNK